MPSREASLQNLEKARAHFRPPRPWRSREESRVIERFVFQWVCSRDPHGPSGRAQAKGLGISHTWLQKLVRRFRTDPRTTRSFRDCGEPTVAELIRAQEQTQRMRAGDEVRDPPMWKAPPKCRALSLVEVRALADQQMSGALIPLERFSWETHRAIAREQEESELRLAEQHTRELIRYFEGDELL